MKKYILLGLGLLPWVWMLLPGGKHNLPIDATEKESGFINTDCSLCDSVSVIDSMALVALYESAGGDNWTNAWSWDLTTPVCMWKGVSLDMGCRVIEVDLMYRNVHGVLPSEIGNLKNLKILNLKGHYLSGSIPPELGDMEELTHLNLQNSTFNDSSLTGGIPNELGRLTNLTLLDLSSNYYIGGSFPDSLCNLTNLETLSLRSTQMMGTVPPCLGNLTALKHLDLENCDFINTTIPSSLGGLENLETLFLGSCGLISPIPDSLSNLSALKTLNLGHNNFNEPIPDWIWELTTLGYLKLTNGKFTGPISENIHNLNNLSRLYMEGNPLGGTIPEEIGELILLRDLRLSGCELIGPIPDELGNLHSLCTLRLNNNNFNSEIPASFGGLSELRELNIRQSHLTGSIPDSLGNLENLQKLILEINHLDGMIPPELGNLLSLFELKLGGNDLTGAIPSSLEALENLNFLGLNANDLTGSIPQELSKLENLRILELSYNDLAGTIPDSLGYLISLKEMHLDSNAFEGEIPQSLGGLPLIQKLDLSRNQLSGAIPDTLGNLSTLIELRFDFNNLTDTIPLALGGLENLEILILSNNNLYGPLPPTFGDLESLRYFSLAFNALAGAVPPELANLQNLEHLRLHDNNLSGCIPSGLMTQCSIISFILENNPKLPWSGDVDPFCMGEQQIGAPCDDCNPQTENDTITTDCTCAGECFIQIFTNIDTTLCFNESISIGNATYDAAGIFSELLNTSFGCDSIVNLTLDFYPEAVENFSNTLCIGESLEINGIAYDEDNPSDTLILFGEGVAGCDSTIHINLNFVTEAGNAGEDEVYCDESEASLSGSLPNMTFGLWTTVNTNANIENPDQPDTEVSNLSEGENIFVWTLSTAQCADYHSDTVIVTFYSGLPFAFDDDFIGDINTPVIGNFLSNDDLEEVTNLEVIFPVKIIEEETTLPYDLDSLNFDTDSTFSFTPGIDLCGNFVFEYKIQNADCPEFCDSARVRIVITPSNNVNIVAPNVITPNGDKYNEFFIIPKLHVNPGDYPNNRLMIFNQWGSLVYEAKSYQNDWNGINRRGASLPQATYYYYFDDGNGETISGKVVILK